MVVASWRPALIGLNLCLLTAIAYFGARITGAVVAMRWEPAPTRAVVAAVAPRPAPAAEPLSRYAVIAERDLFNAGGTAAPSETRRTDLNVKLWGTAVGSDPDRSFAIIEDQAARRQDLYRIGDRVLDLATLQRVEWDRVILERDGVEEVLELAGVDQPAAAPMRGPAIAERIRRTTGNKFVIDRRELERTLENLNHVFTQARAVPYFEDGKTVGFRVFAIKAGSVFEKIGLKNGDIIKRVNGVEITDPTKALSLFTELQNEGHVALDLQRKDRPQSFSYEIR